MAYVVMPSRIKPLGASVAFAAIGVLGVPIMLGIRLPASPPLGALLMTSFFAFSVWFVCRSQLYARRPRPLLRVDARGVHSYRGWARRGASQLTPWTELEVYAPSSQKRHGSVIIERRPAAATAGSLLALSIDVVDSYGLRNTLLRRRKRGTNDAISIRLTPILLGGVGTSALGEWLSLCQTAALAGKALPLPPRGVQSVEGGRDEVK